MKDLLVSHTLRKCSIFIMALTLICCNFAHPFNLFIAELARQEDLTSSVIKG